MLSFHKPIIHHDFSKVENINPIEGKNWALRVDRIYFFYTPPLLEILSFQISLVGYVSYRRRYIWLYMKVPDGVKREGKEKKR